MFKVLKFLSLIISIVAIGYFYHLNINARKSEEFIFADNIQSTQFTLYNQLGETVTNSNLLGKYTLVFFGYSRCSSTCPQALDVISYTLSKTDQVEAFFITLDPDFDTVPVLRNYHKAFDYRIQMLTGSKDEIERARKAYGVHSKREHSEEDDVMINHSSIVYLIGKKGEFITAIVSNHSRPHDFLAEVIKNINLEQ